MQPSHCIAWNSSKRLARIAITAAAVALQAGMRLFSLLQQQQQQLSSSSEAKHTKARKQVLADSNSGIAAVRYSL